MRVLVCGGRMFGEYYDDTPPEAMASERKRVANQVRLLRLTLDEIYQQHGSLTVIHGAAKGAGRHAGLWARRKMTSEEPYKADWKTHGKAAGPIRNQRMIDEGKPDLVIAFPGGKGTADMVRRARRAGLEVREIDG